MTLHIFMKCGEDPMTFARVIESNTAGVTRVLPLYIVDKYV
jgi:hypothetical protein